jgi:hypothetical protein
MTNYQTTIENCLSQIEAIKGSKTFIYDGESFLCHTGQQVVSSVLETGGFSETQQTVIVVRKSQFTDGIYPQVNERITYNSVNYFVDVVTPDSDDVFLNIALKLVK